MLDHASQATAAVILFWVVSLSECYGNYLLEVDFNKWQAIKKH